MARDDSFSNCPLFFVANQETWKVPPIRDFTDLLIILALFGFDRQRKTVNIASISELTGISRATATRRMRHLVEHKIVDGQRINNCTIITLTPTGTSLVQDLAGRLGCANGACRR